MTHSTRRRRGVAAVAAMTLLLNPLVPFVAAAQTPAQPSPAAAAKTGAATPASAKPAATPIDGGWPRTYPLPSGGSVLVYQPQVSSWDKQTHLVAFSAASFMANATAKPAMGTVKFEGDTKVALTERLVSLQKV